MIYNTPFKQTDSIVELGGGQNPRFRPNVDVRAVPEVDIVADLSKPLPLNNNEWDGVFCSYALEHISWRNVRDFIKETFRILAPGGTAVFITADLLEQARMLTEAPSLDDKWVGMVFGDNDYPENSHRCGFSPESAGRIFKEIGFDRVTIIRHPDWRGDMIIEATKEKKIMTPAAVFDKDYFNGGRKVGGYKNEGYRDFEVHWATFDHIMKMKPESVLEIGCARGYILKRLQDCGIPAEGMEVSKHCYLTRAIDNIIRWDICNTPWPIPDKAYDVCLSVAVMEHIPEHRLDDVLREIDRVSRRGLHGIDFGEDDDGFDQTHCTLRAKDWWLERMPINQIVVDKESIEEMNNIYEYIPVGDEKLKLNLGCCLGMFHYGWVNMDIIPLGDFAKEHGYKFIQADLRNAMPFESQSVDLIYSSHFLEHLTTDEALKFLVECRRVVKSGGTIRLMVPDAALLIDKYKESTLGDFDEINDACAATNSQSEKLWSILMAGHKAAYDFEAIKSLAKKAGFKAERKAFREGHPQIIAETVDMLPCLSLFVELS